MAVQRPGLVVGDGHQLHRYLKHGVGFIMLVGSCGFRWWMAALLCLGGSQVLVQCVGAQQYIGEVIHSFRFYRGMGGMM